MAIQSSEEAQDPYEIPVLILAGGLGTRLRPVFSAGPKSMAPIGGRPFLEYLLLQIGGAGFRKIVLCVGHERSQIESWLGDARKWGLSVQYSVEQRPLGTAGAIKQAALLIDSENFLVLNGDSLFAVDLRQLVQEHLRSRAWATIALAKVTDAKRYGTVAMGSQGEVTAFLEKSADAESDLCDQHLINGGIYVFTNRVLDLIPGLRAVSLEREIFPQLLAKGVRGFVNDGYFIDIGVPEDFRRAQIELPGRF